MASKGSIKEQIELKDGTTSRKEALVVDLIKVIPRQRREEKIE